MIRRWFVLPVALLFALAASLAYAQGGGFRGRAGGQRGAGAGMGPGAGLMQILNNPALAEEAGITDEQLAQLREIVPGHREEMMEAAGRVRDARESLRDAMEAGSTDAKALRETAATLSAAQAAVNDIRVKHYLAISAILSPEQMQKLRETVAGTMGRGMRGHGHGRGMGFGAGGDRNDPLFD